MMDIDAFLEKTYDKAMSEASGKNEIQCQMDSEAKTDLDMICPRQKARKASWQLS